MIHEYTRTYLNVLVTYSYLSRMYLQHIDIDSINYLKLKSSILLQVVQIVFQQFCFRLERKVLNDDVQHIITNKSFTTVG